MRLDDTILRGFQGAARSALIARWSGAAVVYGARNRGKMCRIFYTAQVLARGTHVVEQNLSLAEAVAGRPLEMLMWIPYDEAAKGMPTPLGIKTSQVRAAEPGAGWGAKQWAGGTLGFSQSSWQKMASRLDQCGPGEKNLAQAVEATSGAPPKRSQCAHPIDRDYSSRRSVIGGDTGPMHLAAAWASRG